MNNRVLLALTMLSSFIMIGCTGGIRESTTARTATEILLVSTAAERAIQEYNIDNALKGQKVSIDDSFYDAIDKKYVVSALRNHLATNGVTLVGADAADYVMEIRSGSLGLYNSNFAIGLPSLPVVLGNIGASLPPIVIPPLALIARDSAQGWCKIQLWVYDKKTNKHVSSSGDLWGSSYYNQWKFLLIGPFDTSNDVYPD